MNKATNYIVLIIIIAIASPLTLIGVLALAGLFLSEIGEAILITLEIITFISSSIFFISLYSSDNIDNEKVEKYVHDKNNTYI